MNLEILSIKEHGDATKEYVMLRANATIDLGNYAIVDTTFNKKGGVSNVMRHYYRFPKGHIVKKGDCISLWTCKGTNRTGLKTTQGDPLHRFYWGSSHAIWNDSDGDVAELLLVKTLEKTAA
ncbi:MAG: hypothetical protein EOO20_10555 [Chryseobacterium sp.]|nr:MAG: hypothetical protein EOO20_10555 [Chryseobacterium sp.]